MTTTFPAAIADRAAPALRAAGLGLALYLGALGLLRLPCPGGGCDAVQHGRWGALLGVPVGFFGAALWLATLALRGRAAAWSHHALALGSVGFVALQALVIGRFCPWCLAHAALCWAAWPARASAGPRVIPLTAGLALAVALAGSAVVSRQPPAAVRVADAPLADAGFDWLRAPGGAPADAVVLSLTCPLCLDLLADIPAPKPGGPRILFLTTEENRALTERFVAAVLAHPAGPADSFPALAMVLVARRDLVLARPAEAAEWFAESQPESASMLPAAETALAAQQKALAAAGIKVTPVCVTPSGAATTPSRW